MCSKSLLVYVCQRIGRVGSAYSTLYFVMCHTSTSCGADLPAKGLVRRSLKYGVALCLYLDNSDG